jgi:cellulose synthase/poly-beta-1,6-N-acetylglucosamine synthase-like glycosyltransferase
VTLAAIGTYIFAALGAAMLLVHIIVAMGTVITWLTERRLLAGATRGEGAGGASLSVVVPAKNEQFSLPRLLESFEAQDTDEFEIVLVNDRSTDETAGVMETFRERHPDRVRVVTVEETPAGANPKQNALAHGSEAATGEILLLTDADCIVPPQWVRNTARYFAADRVGLVFGPVYPDELGSWLSQYQSFDHVFRYFYTAGSAGIGNATGGFGNNLSVRRSTLDSVGGFAGLRHSVTEDAELISEVRDQGEWRIRAHTAREATVHPEPQRAVGALLKQGIRWNTGALFAPDWATRASFGLVMLYLFASVVLAPIGLVYAPVLFLPAGSFSSMVLMGVVAGLYAHRPGRYWAMLVPNVVFSMLFYSLVTLLTLLRAKISWKGSTVRR